MIQKTDKWLETNWQVSKADVDVFLTTLDHIGCLGSFEELDLDQEKEQKKTTSHIKAYFPDRKDTQDLETILKVYENENIQLVNIERIPYGDWATAWKEFFHPFALTSNIIIRPSWEEYAAKENENVITLDPGMAFGTGQHDTTKFCAEFLCDLLNDSHAYKTLLDVGCGSGILSFIARKLGVSKVIGIDIEQPAIDTCFENLDLNSTLKPIEFKKTSGSLTDVTSETYDIVVANIIAEALCDLNQTLKKFLKPKSLLILSGILPSRSEMVKTAFADLEFLDQKTSENWHTYLYRN